MKAPPDSRSQEVLKLSEAPVYGQVELYHAAFAHHLLTRLFECGGGLLHSEWRRPSMAPVAWYITRREGRTDGPDTVIAESENPAHFRAVLARFGAMFINGEVYGGHSSLALTQDDRRWHCDFFMGNIRKIGFWIRVYAHAELVAPPNGGPAEPSGGSGASGGPPSVS